MRIPHLLGLALAGAGCEPFFDPDIGEGEGDFDEIAEDPVHESADPRPGVLDLDGDGEIDERLDLTNLRIVAVEHPDLAEIRSGPVGVRHEVREDGVLLFELDGRDVLAEVLHAGARVELLGVVEWPFDGGEPVEAWITAELR